MAGCCAVGCTNNAKKNPTLSFHKFPANEAQCHQWVMRVNRRDKDGKLWMPNKQRLCSMHFSDDAYIIRKADGKRVLREGAIPTVFQHREYPPSRKAPTVRRRIEKGFQSNAEAIPADHLYALHPSSVREETNSTLETSETVNSGATSLTEQPSCSMASDSIMCDERLGGDKVSASEVLRLERELQELQRKYSKQIKHNDQLQTHLEKVFNKDQRQALHRKGTQGMLWSEETVRKALQLKFACGRTGYQLLLDQGQPLPSLATLQRRVKNIDFESGLLTNVFQMLKLKTEKMSDIDKLCSLTMDEMSIETKIEYDVSSGQIMGNVTLPDHQGIATHGLVFMLAGISSRWKQTIAYYFTGNSTNGSIYKTIVLEIIAEAHKVGLFVCNITSDMGSANQAMWKSFGIGVAKDSAPQVSVPHPCAPDRNLYFMADVPHVIKNLKTAFSKHIINIGSRKISIQPVELVAKHDEQRAIKLAPKLKLSDTRAGHFDKMKVANALHVFSKSVSAAIEFLVESDTEMSRDLKKLCQDTSWFINTLNHWFDLMSSRHAGLALSKTDVSKYDDEISFLRTCIDIFGSMKIGDGRWKPVQTGLILSTTTVINLSDELLVARNLKFLMTARLTQDCLENLFSTIRLKSAVPSAVEFRNSIKIVTVAQFLKTNKNASYLVDESTYLGNYLEKLPQADDTSTSEEVVVSSNRLIEEIDLSESNSLYYLAGWCLKGFQGCGECTPSAISPEPLQCLHSCSRLTILKEYVENALKHPTVSLFNMITTIETVFRLWEPAMSEVRNAKLFMLSKIQPEIASYTFPTCHAIKEKVVNKYLNLRLHIACAKTSAQPTQLSSGSSYLGSKSMAMRALVKKI